MNFVVFSSIISATFARVSAGNYSFFSPPLVEKIGTGNVNVIIKAKPFLFTGDSCAPLNTSVAALLNNSIVLVKGLSFCKTETFYYNAISANALGIIYPMVSPSIVANFWVDVVAPPALIPQLAISVEDFAVLTSHSYQNTTLTISPDHNPWIDVFSAWWYKLGTLALPGILYVIASIQAMFFLYRHSINISKNLPPTVEGVHKLKRVFLKFGLPHLVLTIELVTCFLNFIALLFVHVLDAQTQRFFLTQLSGWGFVCSILASIFWSEQLKQIKEKDSKLQAFLNKYPFLYSYIIQPFLLIVPLMLDTTISVLLCSLRDIQYPLIISLSGLLLGIMELIVGLYFFIQSIRFSKRVASITRKSKGLIMASTSKVDNVLKRLNRCIFWLGFFSILFTICIPLTILQDFYFSVAGFTIYWSVGPISRAASSVCRVNMFYAKDPNKDKLSTSRSNMSRSKSNAGATSANAAKNATSSIQNNEKSLVGTETKDAKA